MSRERIVALARSFPVLVPIMDELEITDGSNWNAMALDRRAVRDCDSARHSAAFILELWNCSAVWECGKFQLGRAAACWDREHRTAFSLWALEMWLP